MLMQPPFELRAGRRGKNAEGHDPRSRPVTAGIESSQRPLPQHLVFEQFELRRIGMKGPGDQGSTDAAQDLIETHEPDLHGVFQDIPHQDAVIPAGRE